MNTTPPLSADAGAEKFQQQATELVKQAAAKAHREKMAAFGRAILKDVRRLDLNFREYQLAQMILELSYGWGRESVLVPRLEIFSDPTGVAKPHVSTNLSAMVEIGLLHIHKTVNGPSYSITTNRNLWKCRPKVSAAAVIEAVRTLRMFNGQDEADLKSFNEDANGHPYFFDDSNATKNFDFVVTSSVTDTKAETHQGDGQ